MAPLPSPTPAGTPSTPGTPGTPASPTPLRLVVVGGGAGGVIATARLLRTASAAEPVDVRLVERTSQVGPGLAYRTRHHLHLLNNYACRLSAHEDDPGDLVRWCRERGVEAHPHSFLPRGLYGDYLTGVLDRVEVPAGSSLTRHLGLVTDVVPAEGAFRVLVSDGGSRPSEVPADRVVLALGNPPTRRLAHLERLGERYLPDPWVDDLAARVGPADRVLLVGTGLTTVDVAARLHAADPAVELVAVSRHGLWPRSHRRAPVAPGDWTPPYGDPGRAAASLRRAVRAAGGEWRGVADTLREHANDLWRSWSPAGQERFVRHLARFWEVHRHRTAPEMAARIDDLLHSGALRLAHPDEVEPGAFDKVVNCTGPRPVPSLGWNPVVDSLLHRGVVRPHHLGLGLDVDELGQPYGGRGRLTPGLHLMGAARRGSEWEVAAIPDLRKQAVGVAAAVAESRRRSAGAGVPG